MTGWSDLSGLLVVRPLSMDLPDPDRVAPFRARWQDTVGLLSREVRHLRPSRGVLEAAFTEGQLRLDGFPKATARPWSEAVILTLVGTPHGDLRYPCSTFTSWQDNVRAIALALEALRKVDRYGVTKRGEQYAGWRALGPGNGAASADRGRELIRRHGGVAQALKATHPDHGGSPADFADVMAARA